MDPMQRQTWRDVVVDVVALFILFGAVLLQLWTMQGAAPWMVAVVAGRWGASSMAKLAIARASGRPPKLPSDPPPAAGGEPEVEGQEEKKPLPSSGIVMLLLMVGSLILTKRHTG